MKRSPLFFAALALLAALPVTATITPQEQTTTESGVDSGGYAWSSSITYRTAPNPDTVSFATHACGPVTVSYASQLKYNAGCVLEECQQHYLDIVLNGDDEPAEACKVGDAACCSFAQQELVHCLQYPDSICLN